MYIQVNPQDPRKLMIIQTFIDIITTLLQQARWETFPSCLQLVAACRDRHRYFSGLSGRYSMHQRSGRFGAEGDQVLSSTCWDGAVH